MLNFRKLPSSASHLDAFCASLMVGVGESYFVAGALEGGVSPVSSGLLLPVSAVLGACMAAFYLLRGSLRRRKSFELKNTVILMASLQGLSLLPLALLQFFQLRSELGFMLTIMFYFFFGFVANPLWNQWLSRLIPEKETSKFFSQRMRFSQAGVLCGLGFGGFLLHDLWTGTDRSVIFAVLFFAAFVARIISSLALRKLEPTGSEESLDILKSIRLFSASASYRSFFGFLFVFYFVVSISSPFVSPYFLLSLKFSYYEFMGALAALFIGKFLVLPWGARWMEKFGVRQVMLVGALGVSPLPAILIWANSFEQVFLLQTVSGCFWALFEMGFTVLFFNHLSVKERIPLLTLYNLFNAVAVAIGGLFGAWLLRRGLSGDLSFATIFGWGSSLRTLLVLGAIVLGTYRIWPERKRESLDVAPDFIQP